jgi:hypothetical protein
MGSSESLRQPTPMSAKSRLRVDSAIKAAIEIVTSPIPTNPVLSRASSSSAFTFMAANGLDASRVTTPDIVELKKVINRKLTPHAIARKPAAQDDHGDDDNYNLPQGISLDTERVIAVESSLENVKDNWENAGFFNNSPGTEDSDDDSDDDLYKAPISPYKN